MNKKIILGLVVILVFGAGAAYLASMSKTGDAKTVNTYESAEHDYVLFYPLGLDIKVYTPDIIAFGHATPDGMDAVAEARVSIIEGKSGESLMDAVSTELMKNCAADGPESSFACTRVASSEPLMAVGYEGQLIYLEGELTDHATGAKTSVQKGPYVAFPLATSGNATKLLTISAPLNKSAAEADTETVLSIAKSVSF